MTDARAAGGLFYDEHMGGEAMADVVERLQMMATGILLWLRVPEPGVLRALLTDAAAEIERLRAARGYWEQDARIWQAGMHRAEAERDRLREGIRKALDEIEDAGPKALKYAAQELRAALGEDAT